MRRQNPFFSPLGCLGAVLMLIGLGLALLFTGGEAFSPGLLSAAGGPTDGGGVPLGGFESHAAFEPSCSHCHDAFRGVSAQKCLSCHTRQAAELAESNGLHGRLINGNDCAACHTDHKGRDFPIARANPVGFDHLWTTYSLEGHAKTYDGQPFACRDCHLDGNFDFNQQVCADCHAQADIAFMAKHTDLYGSDCRACHDGKDTAAGFDHAAAFALEGGHTDLPCERCHTSLGQAAAFTETRTECLACHEEPKIHAGQFGLDCANCHTVQAWQPARLVNHTFPLDHGEGGEVACATCHESTYAAYTCYGCHDAHQRPEMLQKHAEENINDIRACAECHATGLREENGN